jgi:DNA-binding MarR family transcriptional regulator
VLDDDLLESAATIRRGVNRLARRLRLERPERGETLMETSVLAHLRQRGPMTAGELAAAERIQPQSLTRTLASLESDNLIVRQPDAADRRRSVLSITEAGSDALLRDMRQRDSWLALAMASQLTATEREVLRLAGEMLDRLAEADDTTAPYADPHDDHSRHEGLDLGTAAPLSRVRFRHQ